MAKVIGLGGIFFKSRDPKALGAWYRTWLELPVGPYGATLKPEAMPPGGWQTWSAFPADTDYFAPSESPLMINLVVDDLDGCLERVAAGGATVLPRRDDGEYGRFGWFLDPDGNKVELWQPPAERPADAADA